MSIFSLPVALHPSPSFNGTTFFHSSIIIAIVRQYIFQLLVVLIGFRGSRRRWVSSPFLFFLFLLSRVSTNYQTSCMQNDSAFMGTMTMNAYRHHYRENEPQVILFSFSFFAPTNDYF